MKEMIDVVNELEASSFHLKLSASSEADHLVKESSISL